MRKPRLLDLFCGAGGAGEGYRRAGFDVTGVDNRPMPNNPHPFIQADALEYLADHGHEYDVIHASPPCQGYSRMRHLPWLKDKTWPLLIDPVRDLLNGTGRFWVIENVEDAPLAGITLCGTMFGLKVYRHRRFESNVQLLAPPHIKHRHTIGSGSMLNDRDQESADGFVSLVGKGDRIAAQRATGIDWMSRKEMAQAIPPAYTEFIGKQLIAVLQRQEVSA